jgi:lipid-A-disaccharide synthase
MKIAISAAETSGDLIASKLVESLRSQNPQIQIQGLAGEKMTASGCDKLWDMKLVNVMGFSEVLKKLPSLLRLRKVIIDHFSNTKPEVFIGVDAPDFNFAIERKLKRRGVKTVHYISPSVWAWRGGRIKKIKKSTDLVLCVFPFEIDYYKSHNQKAVFVGHPLAQELQPRTGHIASKVVLMMPGSRDSEVSKILPEMLSAARIMSRNDKELIFKLVLANNDMLEFVSDHARGFDVEVSIGNSHDWITKSDLVLVASGTATLEVALVGVPMVVVYKLSALSFYIMSRLIKSPYISLPNVIANKLLVPELIQDEANGDSIASHALDILSKDNSRLIKEFSKIHSQLKRDSSEESARAVIDLIYDK